MGVTDQIRKRAPPDAKKTTWPKPGIKERAAEAFGRAMTRSESRALVDYNEMAACLRLATSLSWAQFMDRE
jgi:hypothetical protein